MRLPRLPLQYLAAFRAAALHQNLRAASEELNLTHSAVSQQIRALETQLGFDVFDRQGRRVVLNAAGAALLRGVERAYQELDQGLRAATAAHGIEQRSLRVTVLPSFAQRWLLPRLGRWHAPHPADSIEIHATARLVDLEREKFDLALRQGLGPWPGLDSEPLFDLSMLPVASPALAHQLIGQPLEALAQAPLLGDASQWEDWFAQAGLRRRLVRVAPRQAMLKEPQRYHIVYTPKSREEPAVRAFVAWLHEETAQSRAALDGATTCLSTGRMTAAAPPRGDAITMPGTAPADR